MSLRAGFVGACPYPVPQGSQVFLRDHALAFREAGHEAHLITYGHGTGRDESGIPLHRAPRLPGATRIHAGPSLEKPLLDLVLVFTLRRVVREQNLQLLFAHNYEALLAALAARACPVVYHAHNTMEDELPHYFRGARAFAILGRVLDRSFPRRADAVISPHPRLAAHLIACGVSPDRIDVIAPPVWLDQWPTARVGGTMPPVDYTGNLDPYQNIGLLYRAMDRLRTQLPTARLRVATSNTTSIPGADSLPVSSQADLCDFLAEDSVIAVPRTSWTGYPVKILNAMAAGKAIVACAGSAHALRHNETALVVPDNDEEAFADALHTLLTQPALRERLGSTARNHIKHYHAPRATGELLAAAALRALKASPSC